MPSPIGRPPGAATDPSKGRPPGPPERHGHRAGHDALLAGEPFRGLALAKEAQVTTELEVEGVDALLIRDAIRLQTVCDLYYDAILCASQRGELPKLETYLSRHAGLTKKAMEAWQVIRELQQAQGDEALDYEKILAERRRDDGHS